jgi:biotin carboxylase
LLIVVVSALRTALEDALAARGERVLAVVPEAVQTERRALAAGRYEVRAVSDWDDLGQLVRLADALSDLPVRAVETTDEPCLRPAALLRGLLQTGGGLTWAQAVAATDKAVQKDLLVRAGVPVTAHRRISAVAKVADAGDRHLGWPVVVKPRRGFGTLGTRLVRDRTHLAELLAAGAFAGTDGLPASMTASGMHRPADEIPGGLVAEALVRVRAEYHIELLRYSGRELYAIPARYVAPVLGSPLVGSVLLQPGPEHDATASLARAAADALGLTNGFAHVEVLRDEDGVWRVGEIGLRPGGARVPDLLRLHHRIDVPELAADLATGTRPQVQLSTSKETTAWVSAVAPSGTVTAITPTEEIRGLPGVIDARTDLHPGATASGPHGSTALATHVYTQGATAEHAEQAALAAITAWHVDIAAPAEHQAA